MPPFQYSSDQRSFEDRRDAGRQLVEKLARFAVDRNVLVLALPRGGVPVAYEVAHALHAQLDVFPVRKLRVPGHEELAMGAIAPGGIRVLNEDLVQRLGIDAATIEAVAEREERLLRELQDRYGGGRSLPEVSGRTVILVDDGLATGATMRAAIAVLRQRGAGRLIVAVPVGAPETCMELGALADEVVCAITPPHFLGVSRSYENFFQTSDEEVRELLALSALSMRPTPDRRALTVPGQRG